MQNPNSQLSNIQINNFKGEIDQSIEALDTHAIDSSVFKVVPETVLYPQDSEDIVGAVNYARENGKTISVRAGGTCMSGGSLNNGIVVNLTRHMNKIEIDPVNRTATVEMGAMFRDIEAAAKSHGLMFGAYTSSKDICGIGGMIGNNASGEKSIRHGATIDNVLSLEVVLSNGEVIDSKNVPDKYLSSLMEVKSKIGEKLIEAQGEVTKVASGYRLDRVKDNDLTSLFVGAQGTLGIVTKAVLRLVPIPEFTRLLLIPIDHINELPYILKTVMAHNPEGVETYDIHTYHRAEKTMLEETKLLSRFFAGSTSLIVLAQFSESTREETDKRARDCHASLGAHATRAEYIEYENIQTAAWKIRRSSFSLLRDHNEGTLRAVPCIEDVIVPIERFDVFIPNLVQILDHYKIFYGYHGHIGDGALRIIPIIDLGSENAHEIIINLCRDVFALVKSLHGNMSSDHSDGIVRSPFIKDFYGEEIYNAFVKIKEILDPTNTMNSGKKVRGTIEAIDKYLNRAKA